MAPRLHAAVHLRIEPPFAPESAWLDRGREAGRLAGAQLDETCRRAGFEPEAAFMVSTLLDNSFTSTEACEHFQAAFEAAAGRRLSGVANAYLCAGWGFVLRHLMRHTTLRRVAVCIVDLDLLDIEWQVEHPVIGRSGFGLSTLLFELPAAAAALPECSGPHPNSAFSELMMAIRQHRQRHGASPTFLPFTQPMLSGLAQRVLTGDTLAPNRYDTWGHCFGSDPWIGLIEWLEAAEAPPPRVLAGAIAFNGYYTLSDIDLAAGIVTDFRRATGAPAPGHADSLIQETV